MHTMIKMHITQRHKAHVGLHVYMYEGVMAVTHNQGIVLVATCTCT